MKLKYILNSSLNQLSKSYFITNEKNENIGYIEGYLNKYGELITVVKIFSNQKEGIGYNAFEKMYKELNEILPIKVIKGCWSSGGEFETCENGMSTNLKMFLLCYENGNSIEESAFNTPTGKWAKKLGYSKIKVNLISKEEVLIDFEI